MRFTRILSVLLMVIFLLAGCQASPNPGSSHTPGNGTETSSGDGANEQETKDPEHESGTGTPVSIFEELSSLAGVVDVDKVSLANADRFLAYEILFSSKDLKIAADFIFPKDYAEKNYPVLLYFSEALSGADDLALSLADRGAIVVRMYMRGLGNSTGARRLGGGDIVDAQTLLSICRSSALLRNKPYYAVGSGEGSVYALRLAQLDEDGVLSGVAVTDTLSELKLYMDASPADVSRIEALLRAPYESKPEEYALRSAVNFANEIDVPVLLVKNTAHAAPFLTQSDLLAEKLEEAEKQYTVKTVAESGAGFLGDSVAEQLFAWITFAD